MGRQVNLRVLHRPRDRYDLPSTPTRYETDSLASDFFKLLTYLTFFCLILTFYGLPLNILRDVYITFRSFVVKCRDLGRYRQATRNMDSLYPNVSAEEMTAMVDKTCIICREDMEYRPVPGEIPVVVPGETGDAVPPVVPPPARTGPNDTPKKLPCGHSFHFHCLRSWLERQQSCPTWYVSNFRLLQGSN